MTEHVSQELGAKLEQFGFTGKSFTEIWAALPDKIRVEAGYAYQLYMSKLTNGSRLSYRYIGLIDIELDYFAHPSPAEAAGNLLLWCYENGYKEG